MFQVANSERARTLVSLTELKAATAAAAAPKKVVKTKAFGSKTQEASNQAEAKKKGVELRKTAAALKRMTAIEKGSNEYKKLVQILASVFNTYNYTHRH